MKKVLITGANGFLGVNLAKMLHKNGYELKLMTRTLPDAKLFEGINYEGSLTDLDDAEAVLSAVQGCDYVIHAAAITAQWGVSFADYERINIRGTKNIVAACLQCGISRFVYVSTANTLGPGSKNRPGTELDAFSLTHIGSGYISSKYIAQQFVLEQVVQKDLQAIVVNPSFLLGTHDFKPSSGKLLMHGLNKSIVYYPSGGKNFVAIDDVCAGILKALTSGKIGECYLLAARNLSYREFYRILNKASGQQPLMIRIPGILLKAGGLLGSLLILLGRKGIKLDYGAARMLSARNYYSGKKAELELGIKYSSIDRAVKNAYNWLKENNYC